MYTHFIIMGSSYTDGCRIAIDYIVQEVSVEFIKLQIAKIKEKTGNLHCVSTHILKTNGTDWSCVVESDSFFDNVFVYSNIDEFIEALKNNLKLSSLDVAEYILAKLEKCEHLKLQKLIYLSHADYLTKYEAPLFSDEICAFSKGPIGYDAYQVFKNYSQYSIINKSVSIDSAQSRILSADDGVKKIKSIDSTLEKYKNFNADDLVNITHRNDSPWSKCYKQGEKYTSIPNQIIKKFHKNEL